MFRNNSVCGGRSEVGVASSFLTLRSDIDYSKSVASTPITLSILLRSGASGDDKCNETEQHQVKVKARWGC